MSSHELRARAADLLSVGINHYATTPDGLPLLAQSGTGPWLEDSSGRRYIDWNMAWGSVALGYRHPEVEAAIRSQLESGTLFSVPHVLEVEVAERLCELIPCAEKVAFGKNGSDVCTAAVRLARTVTGREGILQFGYHGFHDWCAALNPDAKGVPASLRELVHPIPYNDLDGLKAMLAAHGDRIAGLILEPMRAEEPAPGFLAGLVDAAHHHGALVIFDEMVTGFRLGTGGGQELFGVTPDLACFGKALTNGMPLAALVGRADLMGALPRTAYGMTARGETLALAAARANLAVHARGDVAKHLERIGRNVRDAFSRSCKRHGVDAALTGHPAAQGFVLPGGWEQPFLEHCRAQGIFTNGHLLPSIAHGDDVVERSCRVFDEALAACARPDSGDSCPKGLGDKTPQS